NGSEVYWSADGTIVYLSRGTIRRFQPASLQDGALTDPADGRVVGPLALSPDGKSIAYSTIDTQASTRLWIMNLDLRTRYRPNGSAPSTPAYDRRIAFVARFDDLPQIGVMNGDGSRPQELTIWEADFPYTGSAPNWSPAAP